MPAPEWARVANTTIANYIRGETSNILRNRKLLAMLESRGRIKYGLSGNYLDWKVKYRRNPVQTYGDMVALTFQRTNLDKTAQLGWRSYAVTASVTKMEKEKNKGEQAIVSIVKQIGETMRDDMDDSFGEELYKDGEASGNLGIHGLNSWFGVSGASATAPIGTPSDTYAGLSTALGNYGGAASSGSVWPVGTFDPQYDFWSPLVVDWTSTVASTGTSPGWSSAVKTWPNVCLEALDFGIIYQGKNQGRKGMLDMILLESQLWRQFRDVYRAKERISITRGEQGGLYKLGFTDTENYSGVDISSEYGIPATEGYGIPVGMLELNSLQKELFVMNPVDHDPVTQSDRYSADFMGNLKGNPRYFVKFDNVS